MKHRNVTLTPNPLSLAFPVELLREIILVHLVDSFLDLIVEPSAEKNWDPLSSFLHTSVLFREVTASLLQNIFGEPYEQPSDSTIVNYRSGLSELSRAHAFAHREDPKLLLKPKFATSPIPYPPKGCKSHWIAATLDFAVSKMRYRLFEPSSGVSLADASQTYRTHFETRWWRLPAGGSVVPSVAMRLTSAVGDRTIAFDHLVQRISCLRKACTNAFMIEPAYWSVPSDVLGDILGAHPRFASLSRELDEVAENMQRLFSEWDPQGLGKIELPIPLHVLEATQAQAALINLEPPPDRHPDDPLVHFCLRVRESILWNFYTEQREVLCAELAMWRNNRHEAYAVADVEGGRDSAPGD